MSYKVFNNLDTKRKDIASKIKEGKIDDAVLLIDELGNLIKEQKTKVAGNEKTKITYKCSACGLICQKKVMFEVSEKVRSYCDQSEIFGDANYIEVDRETEV